MPAAMATATVPTMSLLHNEVRGAAGDISGLALSLNSRTFQAWIPRGRGVAMNSNRLPKALGESHAQGQRMRSLEVSSPESAAC